MSDATGISSLAEGLVTDMWVIRWQFDSKKVKKSVGKIWSPEKKSQQYETLEKHVAALGRVQK